MKKVVLWAMLLFWSVWLLWMLIFRRMGDVQLIPLAEYAEENLGLIPLRTIAKQVMMAFGGSWHALTNLGGNFLLFLPYGWFLPELFRKLRRYSVFLTAFVGSIIVVELCQFFLQIGVCEVDDVLLNTVGASVGFLIWNVFIGRRKLQ